MSDYDAWAKFVFLSMGVGLITLPIWILPYGIWYIAVGRKEELEYKRQEKAG